MKTANPAFNADPHRRAFGRAGGPVNLNRWAPEGEACSTRCTVVDAGNGSTLRRC